MKKTKNHINSESNPPPSGYSNRDRRTRKTSLRGASFASRGIGSKGCEEAISLPGFRVCFNTVPRDFLNEEEIAVLQNSTAFILRLAMTKNDEKL